MAVKSEIGWAEIAADFANWEGRKSFMYVDTVGRVTVGVGLMLPDVAAAQKLKFVTRTDGKPASASAIAADFQRVSAQPKAKPANSYKAFTQLDLPEAVIDDLLKTLVTKFEQGLKVNFAGYDAYPAPAKRALMDMVYNLGLEGLLKFKNLKKAAESGSWAVAARECERRGPSQARNDWTRDMFLKAAG